MDNKLAEALVLKGVLTKGTEVRAQFKAMGMGSVANVLVRGDFSITKARIREDGKVVFELAGLRDGSTTKVFAEAIEDIDGMDPVRFASVYDITAEGTKAVVGARRGRKPKNRDKRLIDK